MPRPCRRGRRRRHHRRHHARAARCSRTTSPCSPRCATSAGVVAGDDDHAPPVGSRRRRRHARPSASCSARPPEAGDWLSAPSPPATSCSAMGKYGAFELNYSSDIDLIVFYDLARIRLRAGLEVQPFFVRLTRDLVRLLHGAHRRRLRVPHRPAPAPRSRRHAARALHRRRPQLLRELRPELGARRPHQGPARGRRHRRGRRHPRRARALHLAQVPRLRGHRRHPRHEAADPRLPRLRPPSLSPATTSRSAAAASARSSSSCRRSS